MAHLFTSWRGGIRCRPPPHRVLDRSPTAASDSPLHKTHPPAGPARAPPHASGRSCRRRRRHPHPHRPSRAGALGRRPATPGDRAARPDGNRRQRPTAANGWQGCTHRASARNSREGGTDTPHHFRNSRPIAPPRTLPPCRQGSGGRAASRMTQPRSSPVGRLALLALSLAMRSLPGCRDPACRGVKQQPPVSRSTGQARESRSADITHVCRGPSALPARPPHNDMTEEAVGTAVQMDRGITVIPTPAHAPPPARRMGELGRTHHPNHHPSNARPRLPAATVTRTGVGRKNCYHSLVCFLSKKI